MSKETTAARALLAHFNSQLAGRLARRVLKEVSPEARRKLANEIVNMVPKACSDSVWQPVLKFVSDRGAAYVATPGYAAKVQRCVEQNADSWISDAVHATIKEKVTYVVRQAVDKLSRAYMDAVPCQFQSALEQGIKRVARERAEAASKS